MYIKQIIQTMQREREGDREMPGIYSVRDR